MEEKTCIQGKQGGSKTLETSPSDARRVAVLIDGAYFGHTCADLGIKKVDLRRFVDQYALRDGDKVVCLCYYDCLPLVSDMPTEDEKKQLTRKIGYFCKLESLGFNIKKGRLRRRDDVPDGCTQKRTDVQIALDIATLTIQDKIDVLVLVAGDDDFVPAVEYARNNGVHVHLFYGSANRRSPDLLDAANSRTEITANLLNSVLQQVATVVGKKEPA